jgi:hypothetical protein
MSAKVRYYILKSCKIAALTKHIFYTLKRGRFPFNMKTFKATQASHFPEILVSRVIFKAVITFSQCLKTVYILLLGKLLWV